MVNKIRMSRKEAAEKLNISSKTVDRWIEKGKLEADMSLGREKFVLVPEDIIPGYTESAEGNADTGEEQTSELSLKDLIALDKVHGLTHSQARVYDIMTDHVYKARERMGLLEQPEILREREEAVFQAESKLSDEQEATTKKAKVITWREKNVEGLEQKQKELATMLKKVRLVQKWCTDTVATLQSSEVWGVAFNADKSELPDWPVEVDAYEIQNWGTEEKPKKSKTNKKAQVIAEDAQFDDEEDEAEE